MKHESDTIICVCRVTDGSDIPQSMRVGWRAKDRPGRVMPSLEPSLWSEKTVQARMQDRYRKKAVLYFRLPQLQITPFFFFFLTSFSAQASSDVYLGVFHKVGYGTLLKEDHVSRSSINK